MTFCLLHMKLRICEKLFKLAATEAHRTRNKQQLEAAIRDLGVHMTITRKKGKLQVTSMNGRDCEKLMAASAQWVPAIGVEDPDKAAEWLQLWETWADYFETLNYRYDPVLGPSQHAMETAHKQQGRFGETFLSLFDKSEVTPYIHIAMEHAVDHLERFRALWLYSNEGFEAANKRHRWWYGQCTQRGGVCGGKNQHKASHKNKGTKSCPIKQLLFKNFRFLSYKLKHLINLRAEDMDSEDDSEGVTPETKQSESHEKEDESPYDYDEQYDSEDEDYEDLFDDLAAPLSASQLSTLTDRCSRDCLQDKGHYAFEQDKLTLTADHLQALIRGDWLSTDTINAAFRDLNSAQSTVLALPTHWSEKLFTCQQDDQAWSDLEQWQASVDIQELLRQARSDSSKVSYLYMPIHRTGHWVAVLLDLRRMQWCHLDSWRRGGSDDETMRELNHLKAFVNHLAGPIDLPLGLEDYLPPVDQQYLSNESAKPLDQRSPGGDCGVFVVAWAFALTNNTLVGVDQQDMPTIRGRLAHRLLARRAQPGFN